MFKTIAYNLTTEGNTALSKNFKVKEFACKDGSPVVLINEELVEVLQKIRDKAGAAITLNCGYRTYTHNTKVGGSKSSYHMVGYAADIRCEAKTAEQIAKIAHQILGKKGAVILYPKDKFVHVDVRDIYLREKITNGVVTKVTSF